MPTHPHHSYKIMFHSQHHQSTCNWWVVFSVAWHLPFVLQTYKGDNNCPLRTQPIRLLTVNYLQATWLSACFVKKIYKPLEKRWFVKQWRKKESECFKSRLCIGQNAEGNSQWREVRRRATEGWGQFHGYF